MTKDKKCIPPEKAASDQCVKKTNILVYEDKLREERKPQNKCPPPIYPIIKCANAKRIKICSGHEMRKMVAPRACECPKGIEKVLFYRRILNLVTFGMKSAIALGVVYVTMDMGVWGTPQDTEEALKTFCESIPCDKSRRPPPHHYKGACAEEIDLMDIQPYDPCACKDAVPVDHEKFFYHMMQYWNCAVVCFFDGIIHFPYNIIDYVKKKRSEMSKPKDEQSCHPKKK